MKQRIHIVDTPSLLAQAVAQDCIALATETINRQGSFHLALSGGRTPKRLFELLSQAEYKTQLDWERIHIYFGDERCVPPNHADSNFRMANETLLSRVDCPPQNIHRIEGELDPQQAANRYGKVLQQQLPRNAKSQACFDLIFLGLGADGHTASLFPGTPALQETERSCCAVYVEKLQSWRVTLTYPIINRAQQVWLLIEGEGKAEIISSILQAESKHPEFPVTGVCPSGELHWYLDAAAARLLSS